MLAANAARSLTKSVSAAAVGLRSAAPRHCGARRSKQQSSSFATSAFPAPKLFDYETVTSNLNVADAIESVEQAFSALAKGNVDVPMPMHIGIEATETAGPGDCHIKGGYVLGAKTFTVKLACVSFYKNLDKGLPPGSGLFCVVDAVTGAPLAVMQENRYMTDLRTGAGT